MGCNTAEFASEIQLVLAPSLIIHVGDPSGNLGPEPDPAFPTLSWLMSPILNLSQGFSCVMVQLALWHPAVYPKAGRYPLAF